MIRYFLVLPGIFWLLMPPVCICKLPQRLTDVVRKGAPLFPAPAKGEDKDHAPWCPALKGCNPYANDGETPTVSADAGIVVPDVPSLIESVREVACFWLRPQEIIAGPDEQLTYLLLRALRN
jgi:hypothetical protein